MIFDYEKLIDIFIDTMAIIDGSSELTALAARSANETEVFEDCLEVETDRYTMRSDGGRVSVVAGTTFDASRALAEKYGEGHKVAALNFANAYNPGGGVTGGARAQEECLCRCSTLYSSLEKVCLSGLFYKGHRLQKQFDYEEMNQPGIIFTPDAAIIKTDDYQRLNSPVLVDVITCAAPEMFHRSCSEDKLRAIHREKAKAILDLAVEHDDDLIVLGAFGCGAFMNPPRVVAEVYREVLNSEVKPGLRYLDCFTEIVFAIRTERERESENFEAFKAVLADLK